MYVHCYECAGSIPKKYFRYGKKFFCSKKCFERWATQLFPPFIVESITKEVVEVQNED